MSNILHYQACRDLSGRGWTGSWVYAPVWLLIILTTPLWYEWPTFSIAALAILAILGTIRGYYSYRFEPIFRSNPERWYAVYFFCVISTAITYGIATAFTLWFYYPGWSALVTIMSMVALVSGGMASLSTHLRLQTSFKFSMIMPPLIATLLIGDTPGLTLAALLAITLVFLLVTGRRLNDEYWSAIKTNELLSERAVELEAARAKAEELGNAKGIFMANMSHEIRTPINGIMGMTELALETDLTQDQSHLLKTSYSEAESLLGLINDILDYSKIEAGKLDIENTDFNLRLLFENVLAAFATRAEKKGLDILHFIEVDVPIWLRGDPARLRQILVNLTNNALKFTDEGEIYVCISLSENTSLAVGEQAMLRFEIKDTGIGIPKDKQDSIFESFVQADLSTTRKHGGTGLGTTISKNLVELMGGEIGLESEENQGSLFWFDIPFEPASKEQHTMDLQTDTYPAGLLAGKRVLFVDDNQTSRFILNEHLQSWACDSLAATEGSHALDVLRQMSIKIDLILSDYVMPKMNGVQLLERIRANEQYQNIPVVLLSSIGNINNVKRDGTSDFQGYLSKPVRKNELYDLMVRVLNHQNVEARLTENAVNVSELIFSDYRILLVEDYPTNQQVAMHHLQNVGFQIDLAENGQQAVDAWGPDKYDVILMDIQMPEMDGYEATQLIRQKEESAACRRTPIIAMTAHALDGYREQCLEKGMDDYVSKPFKKDDLLDTVAVWASAGKSGGSSDKISSESPVTNIENLVKPESLLVMDLDQAVEEFSGDNALLLEVTQEFLADVKAQTATLHQAIREGDAESLMREAHSIKGGAGNLIAQELAAIASELEKNGRRKEFDKAAKTILRFEQAYDRLVEFVSNV